MTASGEVRMNREGNYLAADQVVWNRKSGEVRALGNVVVLTPQGDKLVGDNVVLTDTLQDGTVENLLVVLEKTRWKIKGPDGAAELLGVKPTTLLSRIKKMGLQRGQRAQESEDA